MPSPSDGQMTNSKKKNAVNPEKNEDPSAKEGDLHELAGV